MAEKAHWEKVYETKAANEVSWYQPHATKSVELIEGTGLGTEARIIDVGGGDSMLVDDLLAKGYRRLTVLDISGPALRRAQERLRERRDVVHWIEADVTRAVLPENGFDVWHDRAAFHFLTDAARRLRYVDTLKRALRSGGFAIVAAFGPEGPQKCSGLEIVRYSAEALHQQLGEGFALVRSERELHRTPGGNSQQFTYACFRRR